MRLAKLKGVRTRAAIFKKDGYLLKNIPIEDWDCEGGAVVQYDEREAGQVYYVDGIPYTDPQEAKQAALTKLTYQLPYTLVWDNGKRITTD